MRRFFLLLAVLLALLIPVESFAGPFMVLHKRGSAWANTQSGEAYSGITGTIYAIVSPYGNVTAWDANFGQAAFAHSVPSGYNSGLYSAGPTYATWNAADKHTNIAIVAGAAGEGLQAQKAISSAFGAVRSTVGVSSGKWYWEYTYIEDDIYQGAAGDYSVVGIATSSATLSDHIGADAYGWGYYKVDGNKVHSDSLEAYGDSFAQGDVIGVALDMDNGKVWFSKNGVWQNGGVP